MALTREIEKTMKECDYNLYALAELYCDLADEKEQLEKELKKEMDEHVCSE